MRAGSRGAVAAGAVLRPTGQRGLNTEDPADIRRTAELAIQHGISCAFTPSRPGQPRGAGHLQRVFREHPRRRDLRWRVEHAQHLARPTFRARGSWAWWRPCRNSLHVRRPIRDSAAGAGPARGAYVWQKRMQSGAWGERTDAPVEDVSPLASSSIGEPPS